jgi:hypothetical protein
MSVHLARRVLSATSCAVAAFAALTATQKSVAAASTGPYITSFQLVAPGTGWAASQSHLYLTNNNGSSWNDITPAGVSDSTPILGAYFSDARHGVVPLIDASNEKALQMHVAVTADAGSKWESVAVNLAGVGFDPAVPPQTISVDFFDTSHGWIMVNTSSGPLSRRGFLISTADGGVHWSVLPAPPIDGQIVFGSARNGILATTPNPYGDTNVWYSRNAGESWTPATLPLPKSCAECVVERIGAPAFSNSTDATVPVILRTPGKDNSTVVDYETTDGGATWRFEEQSLEAKKDAAFALHSERGGKVVGIGIAQEGAVDITLDGKRTSLKLPGGLSQGSIAQISVTANQTAWALYVTESCAPGHRSPCIHPADQVRRAEILSIDPTRNHADLITPTRANISGQGGTTASDESPAEQLKEEGEVSDAFAYTHSMLAVHPDAGAVGLDTEISDNWYGMDGLNMYLQSTTTMQNWFNWSPYYDVYVYIGGVNRKTGTVSRTLVQGALEYGWGVGPIWVGYQNPCTTLSYTKIPSNASGQGATDATSALDAAEALGITSSVVYLDMEALPAGVTNTAACQTSTLSYIESFTTTAKNQGWAVGIYSSGSSFSTSSSGSPTSFLSALSSYDNVVWDATSIGCKAISNSGSGATGGCTNTTLFPLAYINSSLWTGDGQRAQQFTAGVNNTWPPAGTSGATTIQIDEDFDNGLVYPPYVPQALPAPTLTYPADTDYIYLADAGCCEFTWTKPNANMTGYEIVFDEDPSNLPTSPEQDGCPSCNYQTAVDSTGGSTTSVTLPPDIFDDNTYYYWTVKAYGMFKYGNWSTPLEFCSCSGEGTVGPEVRHAAKARLEHPLRTWPLSAPKATPASFPMAASDSVPQAKLEQVQ